MTVKTATYPRPGTRAEDVLNYIRLNPGTTKNAIIEKLSMNPSVVRDAVRNLISKGLVEDKPDSEGRHHYFVKERM